MFAPLSAEVERPPRLGSSVVTREDLRRWALSASKTTYLGTSAWLTGGTAEGEDLEGMLVLGLAGTGVAVALQAVSLALSSSLTIMRNLLHPHHDLLPARL